MPSKQKQTKLEKELQDLHRRLKDLQDACQRLLQDADDGRPIADTLGVVSRLLGNK